MKIKDVLITTSSYLIGAIIGSVFGILTVLLLNYMGLK